MYYGLAAGGGVCVVRKQVFRGRYSAVGGVATGVKRGAPMYGGGKEMKCNETDDANGQLEAFTLCLLRRFKYPKKSPSFFTLEPQMI